jgi:hypothetical protein
VETLESCEGKDWKTTRKKVDKMLDEDETAEMIEDVALEMYIEVVPELATSYMQGVEGDMAVDTLRQRTSDWLVSWSQRLGELMKTTSHNQITNAIQETIDNGDDIATLTRRIQEGGWRSEYYQAKRVAVTEVLRAHSVAQEEAIQQSPATDRKIWRHTGAHKNQPRQNHVDMDGQIVPKDQPFEMKGIKGGTYSPMYPRDPSLPPEESINCHCIHYGVANDEILGMTYEERRKMQQEIIDGDDGEWEKELAAENKARAGIEVDNDEKDIQYMSKTVKPKYSGISKVKIGEETEISVKKVSNSRFDMYTDIKATDRNMAVRLTEKKLVNIEKSLPKGFEMPKIVVTDFAKANLNTNAIGGYSRDTNTMYLNSKYKTEKSIKKYLNNPEGWFANKTTDAPYLHELGHKYHYDSIEKLANSRGLSYSNAKQIYESSLDDFLKGKNAGDSGYLQENISGYALYGYEKSGENRLNEVMAEWFTMRDEKNPSELVSFITNSEGAWKE